MSSFFSTNDGLSDCMIHYLFSTAQHRFLKQLQPKEVDAYQALSDTLYPQIKQNQFFIQLASKDPQTPISRFFSREAGPDKYHPSQLTIKGEPLIIEDFAPISSPRIAIHIDTLGRHWLASQNRLWLFNRQGQFLLYLSQEIANQVSVNWNPSTEEARQFTTLDGLTHNVLYTVLEDEAGYFWITNNKGLMRFDPRNQDIISFRLEDGITHEGFNSYSYLQTSDGRFFFGGLAGIAAFRPQEL